MNKKFETPIALLDLFKMMFKEHYKEISGKEVEFKVLGVTKEKEKLIIAMITRKIYTNLKAVEVCTKEKITITVVSEIIEKSTQDLLMNATDDTAVVVRLVQEDKQDYIELGACCKYRVLDTLEDDRATLNAIPTGVKLLKVNDKLTLNITVDAEKLVEDDSKWHEEMTELLDALLRLRNNKK